MLTNYEIKTFLCIYNTQNASYETCLLERQSKGVTFRSKNVQNIIYMILCYQTKYIIWDACIYSMSTVPGHIKHSNESMKIVLWEFIL